MPRKRRIPKALRRGRVIPIQAEMALFAGWTPPKTEADRDRSRWIGWTSLADARHDWHALRESLLSLWSESPCTHTPWAIEKFERDVGETPEQAARRLGLTIEETTPQPREESP